MSATADASTTTAGANPSTPADSARLEQPNDAVAMNSMGQSSPDVEGSKVTEATDSSAADDAHTTSDAAKAPTTADSVKAQVESKGKAVVGQSSEGQDLSQDDNSAPPRLQERQDSVMAIGPAQDEIKAVTPGTEDVGPVCNITLLLTSGSRHPYKISAKYLSRRNVAIPDETEDGLPDPFSISIYTLKELILREWRQDWDGKPTSPSSIRLIHFGKLLDDKEPLKSMAKISADSSKGGTEMLMMPMQSTNSSRIVPMLYT